MNNYKITTPQQARQPHDMTGYRTQETVEYNKYDSTYHYKEYTLGQQTAGFIALTIFIGFFVVVACWPRIKEWFKGLWYRNYTIRSFIICQKSPKLDMKKIYKTVDDTNDFLRGKDIRGLKTKRKKIKTKNLISVTSTPGEDCYYFIVWYKGR